MEWNQLQRFLVIAREENLSRAAQILHTSQPSLSQIVKRLEKELGYSLFDREGKNIHLNESGKIFLQTVKQMDELMQNTLLKLEEKNRIHHPEVTIYFSTVSTLLPDMLLYLKKKNPDIRYRIHQWKPENGESDDDIQILMGPIGKFAGLGMGESEHISNTKTECSKNIIRNDEILLVEEILLALPKNHILVEKKQIMMSDLIQEEFIFLNENWELGKEIRQEMDRIMFKPEMDMLVDNPSIMRELLKLHMGIAFVPAISWHSFAGEDIVIRHVEDFSLSRVIYLHTKPRKYLTKEQKECIRGIKEFFDKRYQKYYK